VLLLHIVLVCECVLCIVSVMESLCCVCFFWLLVVLFVQDKPESFLIACSTGWILVSKMKLLKENNSCKMISIVVIEFYFSTVLIASSHSTMPKIH
jgi:hypothetical protein